MPVIKGMLPSWLKGKGAVVFGQKSQPPSGPNSTDAKPETAETPKKTSTTAPSPAPPSLTPLANELADALLAGLAQENAAPDAADESYSHVSRPAPAVKPETPTESNSSEAKPGAPSEPTPPKP